eukprot:TRINITY_DN1308_c0_g1_i9.p1 TRINITY_DN1308_c0_g1~~TRINITY_DN1308_c0_g1_i9.p1  ORF type:complete len:1446 (-),score=226.54 TRINITY_DN1308_c0_g1_i9:273-4610(-)
MDQLRQISYSANYRLDYKEFVGLFKKLDAGLEDDALNMLFNSVSASTDGKISFGEFVEVICNGRPNGGSGGVQALADWQSSPSMPVSLADSDTPAWSEMRARISMMYGEANTTAVMHMLKEAVAEHVSLCESQGIDAGGGADCGPRDACIISYANTFTDPHPGGKKPFRCLAEFLRRYEVTKSHRAIHLLPMFPWDTDRGFSVKDYWNVEPSYGTWDDVKYLASEECGTPQLMFDYVCNHASVDNNIVQFALIQRHIGSDHPQYHEVQKYKDFVTAFSESDRPSEDRLKALSRPRAFPPLTSYFVVEDSRTRRCRAILGRPEADKRAREGRLIGKGYVWTTFSRGENSQGEEGTRQVDLNYRNPRVAAEVVRILLFYVRNKSKMIRLDAIGYIWKVLGSASIHERGTHMLLAILYGALQIAAPGVMTIAEVNEPQHKCFTYLGRKGHPEGDMVYNFSGFSMALHAQVKKDGMEFGKWLGSMEAAKGKQFLTVLGSHDGLAQKQARELLPPEELERLHRALIDERGGHVNWAKIPGGKKIVYEICGTPWALVNGNSSNGESFKLQLSRYIGAMSMSLLARGMPGVYINGLIGAKNYEPPGIDEFRTLNREVFDVRQLFPKLDDPNSHEGAVMRAVQAVMKKRMELPQFDRDGPTPSVVEGGDPTILACVLEAPRKAKCGSPLLALFNLSSRPVRAVPRGLPTSLMGCELYDALEGKGALCRDNAGLIRVQSQDTGGEHNDQPAFSLQMSPYEVIWLVRTEPLPRFIIPKGESTPWGLMKQRLEFLMPKEDAATTMELLLEVIRDHQDICAASGISAGGGADCGPRDACIISYANTFSDPSGGKKPFRCLAEFLQKYNVTESHRAVHLLPMFPWDTDRGFSVKDYWKVDPNYGEWEDVEYLASPECGSPQLMFDYVCNHCSIDNPLQQAALIHRHIDENHPLYAETKEFKDFCTAYCEDDGPEENRRPSPEVLSKLARPRAFPPLTPYFVIEDSEKKCRAVLGTPQNDAPPSASSIIGKGYVWTTFSRGTNSDGEEGTRQVDINYKNPKVIALVVKILLFYVRKKSKMIRLDAIGYIWKVLGSMSIHERETHMMLAVLYGALQLGAPGVMTIAEVNEPQHKCFEYLGDENHPEGDMVYNFSGFSLALHAQIKEDVAQFGKWLGTMDVTGGRQFLTVLGSHDGLAQKQARELLPPEELERLHRALIDERQGHVNWGKIPGGKKIVYEICGTPWNLVNGPGLPGETFELQLGRYICAMSLSLMARGMPGIYINGLIGAKNYEPPNIDEFRTLNREVFDVRNLFAKLDNPNSHEGAVMRAVQNVMKARMALPQFDRSGPPPKVISGGDAAVLAVVLHPQSTSDAPPLLALLNVASSSKMAQVSGLPCELMGVTLRDALERHGAICREKENGRIPPFEVQSKDVAGGLYGASGAAFATKLAPFEVVFLLPA